MKMLDTGVTQLNSRQFSEALATFNKGILIDKTIADLYFGKASAAFQLNLTDTAISALNSAKDIAGSQSEYSELRGNIYFRKREIDSAIIHFTNTITLISQSKRKINLVNAYYNRGSCYLIKKEYASAKEDFTEAINLYPNFSAAFHNRGICFFNLEDNDSGCKDMNKAISLGSPRSQKYITEKCGSKE